ncbi:hypothetical protein QN416_26080, partial [Glaciimonas sp. Cout2]|uniref:hypothetical protein n=1 Tax=Glaciimonas sp. Cout2 TaxID=3048621 RepID=UPI002B222C6B
MDTRPQKLHARALSELRTLWRVQAGALVGDRAVGGILRDAQARARDDSASTVPAQIVTVAQAAAQVVETVSE